jgi:hypothetical protein
MGSKLLQKSSNYLSVGLGGNNSHLPGPKRWQTTENQALDQIQRTIMRCQSINEEWGNPHMIYTEDS